MAIFEFGTDDIIMCALYQRQLNGEKSPKVTYNQVEKFKKRICSVLDEYKVNYKIFDGSVRVPNSSNDPEFYKEYLEIKVLKDDYRKIYTFNKSFKISTISDRINLFIPTYIQGFLTPTGFEEDLDIAELKSETQPGQ